MKKSLTIALITLVALTTGAYAASDASAIVAAEKGAWQMIQNKKFDTFQKMLTANFRGVYPTAINNASKEMAEVRTVEFQSVKFGKMDVVFLDPGTALVTYSATVKGTEGGKDISGPVHAATIWKKQGSDWRVAFHTDFPTK